MFPFSTFLLCLWCAGVVAQPNPPDPLDELIGSENAFARLARERGTRPAFLDALDSNSVLFNANQPVNGYQLWLGRPDGNEGLLAWFPAVAAVAASGELGYTIGPSYYKPHNDPEPVYFGYYFSVWRRDPAGRFKVLVDAGIPRPKPAGTDWMGEVQLHDGSPLAKRMTGTGGGTEATLRDAEARLHQVAKTRPKAAYRACLAPDAWVLRPHTPVRKGRETALRWLAQSEVQGCHFTSRGSGVAAGGDLAYTYGEVRATYRRAGGAKEQPGFYVRTWRHTGTGWQLTAELLNHQ
jgi:ketosteroid isomerase-like protein